MIAQSKWLTAKQISHYIILNNIFEFHQCVFPHFLIKKSRFFCFYNIYNIIFYNIQEKMIIKILKLMFSNNLKLKQGNLWKFLIVYLVIIRSLISQNNCSIVNWNIIFRKNINAVSSSCNRSANFHRNNLDCKKFTKIKKIFFLILILIFNAYNFTNIKKENR